jgi:hypothetical protein
LEFSVIEKSPEQRDEEARIEGRRGNPLLIPHLNMNVKTTMAILGSPSHFTIFILQ